MEEVRADMFRYIELFYNRKFLHSVLGYMSSVDDRIKYEGKTAVEIPKEINAYGLTGE